MEECVIALCQPGLNPKVKIVLFDRENAWKLEW